MMRELCLATLLAVLATTALADDTGMCKSLCTSERAQCKRAALKATELDELPPLQSEGRNPMAREASRDQLATKPSPAAGRDAFQKRKAERTGQCDDTYGRCVRACDGPGVVGKVSDVLTKQGQDKRAK